MRILVANPNATEAITEMCAKLARAAASPGTEVIGWTNRYTQDLVAGLGFADRCAAVRAVELPPLDADEPPVDRVVDALTDAVRRLGAETLTDLVILGGSRLSPFAEPLRHHTAMPILEPVACAVQIAEAVVRLGLRQSKMGKFASPPRPLAEYG